MDKNLLQLYKALSPQDQRRFAKLLKDSGFFPSASGLTVHDNTYHNPDHATLVGGFVPSTQLGTAGGGTDFLREDGIYTNPSGATVEDYAKAQCDGRIERTSDTVLSWGGYQIGLYDSANTIWKLVKPAATPTLANDALDLDSNAIVSNFNYDVFAEYVDATSLTLVVKKWTNNTTRAVTPASWQGVLCYDNTTDDGKKRRFLGTVRLRNDAGTAKFTDTVTQRFVWNYYNPKLITAQIAISASSWTYNSAVWRKVNNGDTSLIEMLNGQVTETYFEGNVWGADSRPNNTNGQLGIGLDSTSAVSGITGGVGYNTYGEAPAGARHRAALAIGYHFIHLLERSDQNLQVSYWSYSRGYNQAIYMG